MDKLEKQIIDYCFEYVDGLKGSSLDIKYPFNDSISLYIKIYEGKKEEGTVLLRNDSIEVHTISGRLREYFNKKSFQTD